MHNLYGIQAHILFVEQWKFIRARPTVMASNLFVTQPKNEMLSFQYAAVVIVAVAAVDAFVPASFDTINQWSTRHLPK